MSYDVSIPVIYYVGIQFTVWSHNYFDKSMNKEQCQILEMEKIIKKKTIKSYFVYTH